MIELSNKFKFDEIMRLEPYFDQAKLGDSRSMIIGNIEGNYGPRNGVNPLPEALNIIPQYGAYHMEIKWKQGTMNYIGEGEIIPRISSHILRCLYRPDNTLFKKSMIQRYGAATTDSEIAEIISNKSFDSHWDFGRYILDSYKGKKDPKYSFGRKVCRKNKSFKEQKLFCSNSISFSFFSCDSGCPIIRKRGSELSESIFLERYTKEKDFSYWLNIKKEWTNSRVEGRCKNYLLTFKSSNEEGDQFQKMRSVARTWLLKNVKNSKDWLVENGV